MFPDIPALRQIEEIARRVDHAQLVEAGRLAQVARRVSHAQLVEAGRLAQVARRVSHAQLVEAGRLAQVARRVSHAQLVEAGRLAQVARRVERFHAAIASASAWEASLTARIAELKNAWTLQDRIEEAMMGFARLSRLSDAVHTAAPYSESVGGLVANELGVGVESDLLYDDTPSERDENVVKAGLNPELIAFPPAAYSEVVLAAGFKFHFTPTPVPQAVESPDPGAVVFDPMHGVLLTKLEQRLRHVVEEHLSRLDGPNWLKHRVSEAVRKRCLDRQKKERQAGRPVFAPIQYADFMDLADIISRSDNWREAFESIFQNREDFLVSLRRLHPIRRAIAHSRPLGKSDVLLLVSEATRIFRALEVPLG